MRSPLGIAIWVRFLSFGLGFLNVRPKKPVDTRQKVPVPVPPPSRHIPGDTLPRIDINPGDIMAAVLNFLNVRLHLRFPARAPDTRVPPSRSRSDIRSRLDLPILPRTG